MERNEIGLAQQAVERRESEPRFALPPAPVCDAGSSRARRVLKPAARRATALPINPPPPIKPMVLLQTSEQKGPFGWRNTKSLTIIARMVTARCGSPESV